MEERQDLELELGTAALKNRKGYVTKEEFLRTMKSLNFKYIASYDIKLITEIIIDCKEDKVESLGYTIKLNEYRY